MLVAGADAKVALQGLAGPMPKRQRPPSTTFAEYQQYVQVEIYMGELQISQLGAAGAGIQQQHDDGGVAAGLEALAGAGGQQPAQTIGGDDRYGLLRDNRWLHPRHRVGEFLPFLEPAVQDAHDLVSGGGRVGAAVAQDVTQGVLEVGLGRLLKPLVAASRTTSTRRALSR
jgi:hypothetical protein